jgi:hypothetical protein
MSFINDTSINNIHPAPKDGYTASEATLGIEGYGIKATADVFSGGARDAIIYAVIGTEANHALEIMNVAETETFLRVNISSAVGNTVTFGPHGIRIPGGFSVLTEATAATWQIIYDVV